MFLGKPKPYQTDPKTAGDSLIGSMSGEIATHPSAEKLEKWDGCIRFEMWLYEHCTHVSTEYVSVKDKSRRRLGKAMGTKVGK